MKITYRQGELSDGEFWQVGLIMSITSKGGTGRTVYNIIIDGCFLKAKTEYVGTNKDVVLYRKRKKHLMLWAGDGDTPIVPKNTIMATQIEFCAAGALHNLTCV
jgi:hypothetical protein